MSNAATITEIGPIKLLGIFRLILAILLSIFYLADKRLWPLDPNLSIPFQVTLALYLVFLLLTTLIWNYPKFQNATTVVVFSFIDIALLSGICFYTDGIQSPLIFLILVSIMVHGALMPMRSGLLLVLFSSTIMLVLWLVYSPRAILAQHSWSSLLLEKSLLRILAQTTIASFSVIISSLWSKRFNENKEKLAIQERALETAKIVHEAIVRQVNTGILVINKYNQIVLMNDLVLQWFNENTQIDMLLSDFSEDLHNYLVRWMTVGVSSRYTLKSPKGFSLQVDFMQINSNEYAQTLIVIDTLEHINLKAQEGKLAALGQLTAAIAHEIRNPIAIISQAAQLLREDLLLKENSTKFADMILTNVNRTNRIINDILSIAKKNEPKLVKFDLITFLKTALEEFEQISPESKGCFLFKPDKTAVLVLFDPSQLKQIIWNLLGNTLLHATMPEKKLTVVLNLTITSILKETFTSLTIADNGPGFNQKNIERMFEPFFSTHHEGTGLGLYISKELCLLNNAKLEYVESYSIGACFRITFSPVVNTSTDESTVILPV